MFSQHYIHSAIKPVCISNSQSDIRDQHFFLADERYNIYSKSDSVQI